MTTTVAFHGQMQPWRFLTPLLICLLTVFGQLRTCSLGVTLPTKSFNQPSADDSRDETIADTVNTVNVTSQRVENEVKSKYSSGVSASLSASSKSSSAFEDNDFEEAWFTTGNESSPSERSVPLSLDRAPVFQRKTTTHAEVSCPESENPEKDSMQVPTFILAGAQKAGTTALYHLFRKHPSILGSHRIEAHYFDNLRFGTNASAVTDAEICEARARYRKSFNTDALLEAQQNGTAFISFEKTPIYVCKPHIPAMIRRVVPHAKIVLILRDPVARAYSHWKMTYDAGPERTKSFETFVRKEIEKMREVRLTNIPSLDDFQEGQVSPSEFASIPQSLEYRSLRDRLSDYGQFHREKHLMCGTLGRGLYAQQLVNWLDAFELGVDIHIVRYERFKANKTTVLQEILEFVGAGPMTLEEEVLEHDFAPRRGNVKSYAPLNDSVLDYLRYFYQPYNEELADLLGEDWRGVWDP